LAPASWLPRYVATPVFAPKITTDKPRRASHAVVPRLRPFSIIVLMFDL
jgi:hypothetical protein